MSTADPPKFQLPVVPVDQPRTAAATVGSAVDAQLLALMPPASPLRRGPSSGAEFDDDVPTDWDILFDAVTGRLRHAVGDPTDGTQEPEAVRANDPVQTVVLECVDALEHLHLALGEERAHRRLLELQIADAHEALARTRADLVGTQAGERRFRHLSLHDGLTALPNRSFFRERFDDALVQAEPRRQALAVLYLDLDGFKLINDRHGHTVGDDVLRIVAARLTRTMRAEDMVCRIGGDEFACLLANLPSRQQLGALARKLFVSIAAPLQVGELVMSVRPSIGIATFPTDGDSFEALLKSADAAMYRAKLRHSGHAFCDSKGLP